MAETPTPPPAGVSTAEYRWTLVLFAAVAAALVVWFQRHVEPFVTGTLVIGGTISAWGLWQLGWSFFTDAGGEDEKDLTRRLLGRPGARRALWFAAIVAALLHLFTSSTYLRSDGAKEGEADFTVQAMNGSDIFMGPVTLKPGDVTGHPKFPGFSTYDLEFRIVGNRDFLPLKKTLRPWGALDIKVPGSFERKVYHSIVLVPDAALLLKLPPTHEPTGTRFYVVVTVGGGTAEYEDWTKELIATGSEKEDLPASVQNDGVIRLEMLDHFGHVGIKNPDGIVSGLMETPLARLNSPEFGPGQKVSLEIGTWESSDGPAARQKKWSCDITVPDDGRLHAVVVGPMLKEKCK